MSEPASRPPGEASSGAAIEAEGLCKTFGDFKAVDRVSFSIARGSIFGFVGSNGSGKSTTIRMLCGLLEPTEGSARVAGFRVPGDERSVLHRIGYMSQKLSLYPALSILENVRFAAGIYSIDAARRESRWRTLRDRLDLGPYEKLRVSALSVGIKQRTALCCSILHDPEVVFLDEPTAGVDLENRAVFWEIIREMAAGGITVFVTSHYLDEMEFADVIGFIDGGQMIALDSPEKLKANQAGGYRVEIIGPAGLPSATLEPMLLLDLEPATVAGARRRARSHDPSLNIRIALPTLEEVFLEMLRAREREGQVTP
ncbi:MAG: ABC transporter ATP-binding protein [Deltaproteobacteria bacterium]|nr:ABC transporter ATP-binding protein [Deltaproteobacteria bacterium]